MARSRITRTLGGEAAVARIAAILSQEEFDSRSAFGRRVCKEFAFLDAAGRPEIVLPAPKAPAAGPAAPA